MRKCMEYNEVRHNHENAWSTQQVSLRKIRMDDPMVAGRISEENWCCGEMTMQ